MGSGLTKHHTLFPHVSLQQKHSLGMCQALEDKKDTLSSLTELTVWGQGRGDPDRQTDRQLKYNALSL